MLDAPQCARRAEVLSFTVPPFVSKIGISGWVFGYRGGPRDPEGWQMDESDGVRRRGRLPKGDQARPGGNQGPARAGRKARGAQAAESGPQGPAVSNLRLREIMEQQRVTRRRVAELVLSSPSTVDAWLCPGDSPNYRQMPDRALRLLELELGLSRPAARKKR